MRYNVQTAWALLMGFVVTSLAAGPLRGEGDKADPRVYGAAEKVEGKTYAEWSAAWWQWALAIKKDRNPILDKDGALAGEGQGGPVWFLAGNTGGTRKRKCAVPAGKPVFFPVVNYVEGAPPDKADDKKLVAVAKGEMDCATGLEATLDDKRIGGLERFRVASAVFEFTGPEKAADAVFEDCAGKNKAASDGYWLMLKPLPAGKHTLRFKGKVKDADGKKGFEVDVTYELTAEKK